MATEGQARLTLDTGVALRTRLKIAAARRGVSMRALCLEAIEKALDAEEESKPTFGVASVEAALKISREILRGRVFTEDSADLIRQARQERSTVA